MGREAGVQGHLCGFPSVERPSEAQGTVGPLRRTGTVPGVEWVCGGLGTSPGLPDPS